MATGRRPATMGLNLPAAGVVTDERGAIVVDEHFALVGRIFGQWAM